MLFLLECAKHSVLCDASFQNMNCLDLAKQLSSLTSQQIKICKDPPSQKIYYHLLWRTYFRACKETAQLKWQFGKNGSKLKQKTHYDLLRCMYPFNGCVPWLHGMQLSVVAGFCGTCVIILRVCGSTNRAKHTHRDASLKHCAFISWMLQDLTEDVNTQTCVTSSALMAC